MSRDPISLIELQNDHEAIRQEVDQLRAATEQVGLETNSNIVSQFSHLERAFTQHSIKEEQYLFPLLHRYLDASVCEEVGLEHEEIKHLIRRATNQISHSEKSSIPHLNLLLRKHFSKEENVLFWYLSLRLGEETAAGFHYG